MRAEAAAAAQREEAAAAQSEATRLVDQLMPLRASHKELAAANERLEKHVQVAALALRSSLL